MKNFTDPIGNQTLELPACSAVPQPTALPRAPLCLFMLLNYRGSVDASRKLSGCSVVPVVLSIHVVIMVQSVSANKLT
jgi:hypothetical protein